MSTSLFWEPFDRKMKDAGDFDLKKALQKKYGYPVNHRLDSSDIGFLEGLTAAGVNAQILIDAIEKHGSIIVKELS